VKGTIHEKDENNSDFSRISNKEWYLGYPQGHSTSLSKVSYVY